MQLQSTLAKSAKSSLYPTTNKEYGASTFPYNLGWAHDGVRAETFNLKTATVPTYAEIVDSANDFKKA